VQQPRLSINSVTAQNFSLPVKIAGFVNDIFASYSLVRNIEGTNASLSLMVNTTS
jgi:hypothetical protein